MQVSLVSLVTQITLETFSPALSKSTEKINTHLQRLMLWHPEMRIENKLLNPFFTFFPLF